MAQCTWKKPDPYRGDNWQILCQYENHHKGKCSFDILTLEGNG